RRRTARACARAPCASAPGAREEKGRVNEGCGFVHAPCLQWGDWVPGHCRDCDARDDNPSLIGFGGFGRMRHAAGDADGLADLHLDLPRSLGILLQAFARVVLALADLLAVIGVPRARLLDDAMEDAELDDLAFAGDALVVEDVEI